MWMRVCLRHTRPTSCTHAHALAYVNFYVNAYVSAYWPYQHVNSTELNPPFGAGVRGRTVCWRTP